MNVSIENYRGILPQFIFDGFPDKITDIRISRNSYVFVKCDHGVRVFDKIINDDLFDSIIIALTGGIFPHEDTIKRGYFTDIFGSRCGIVGRGIVSDGKIQSVCDFSAVNIRFGRFIPGAGRELINVVSEYENILIFGPPGCGKTTVLRDAAREMSSGSEKKSVCIIDTRSEFDGNDYTPDCNISIMKSYPQSVAFDVATRCLATDIIICDEISLDGNYGQLLDICKNGVRIIASIHAKDFESLKNKRWFSEIDKKVFDAYVFVSGRKNNVNSLELYKC